jgi:hypothetical protein
VVRVGGHPGRDKSRKGHLSSMPYFPSVTVRFSFIRCLNDLHFLSRTVSFSHADIRLLVQSLCCQFTCVSSATIIARHWIEVRGRGRDCTIMMRTILLALLYFVLEMQIVLAHSSTFWSCILARDVAAISTHLQLFCTP